MNRSLLLVALGCWTVSAGLAPCATAGEPVKVDAVPVWAAQNKAGHPVRIALPAPENARFAHLSWNKAVRTPRGTIVLACLAGAFHGNHGGGSPAVARSTDGGRTFSPIEVLREFGPGRDYTCSGNIALGVAEDGAVVLLAMAYTAGEANHIFGWRSEDDGVIWKPTDTSTLGPNKTGSVFGSILPIEGQGLMVLGHYRSGSRPHTQGIWLATSSDEGKSWGEPRRIADVYAVEPMLVQSADRLIGFFRSGQKPVESTPAAVGRQYLGVSDDGGRTWTTKLSVLDAENPATARLAAPCAVENPQQPGEIFALTTERTLGKEQNSRIWLWRGDAKRLDWQRERVLLEFPQGGPQNPNTDLGYPWLLHVEDARWLLFYYHGRSRGASPIWVTEVELK